MQSATAKFLTTVAGSHTIAVTVDVYYNRAPYATGLAVTDGTVTLDRTAAQRGRAQLTFAEPLKIPTTTGGTLTPYGYEVAVKRGVTYADGTTELMGLGVYPIQTSHLDGISLVTSVDAMDRSQFVADARLEDDYVIAAGVAFETAIAALIADGVTALTYSFAATGFTTPALVFAAQTDRWEAAQGMAKSCGCELYFDGVGTLVLRPEPSFTATSVWTISDGEGGLLTGATLSLDRAQAYNKVIATGENTGLTSVPTGTWTDTDPNSPTYYSGGFGKKPRFYSSPFITTNAQALSAATAIGEAQQGVARSLSFDAVPNPALEPGDVVQLTRTAIGINETHLLDSLTFSLGADGAMSGQSRWGSTS